MPRAVAGDTARNDLPAVGDEVPEHAGVLVIDTETLLRAESTDLTASGAASARSSIDSSTWAPTSSTAAPACSSRHVWFTFLVRILFDVARFHVGRQPVVVFVDRPRVGE